MVDFSALLKKLKLIFSVFFAILLSKMNLPPFARRIDTHSHIFPDFYRKACLKSKRNKQGTLDGFSMELIPVRCLLP